MTGAKSFVRKLGEKDNGTCRILHLKIPPNAFIKLLRIQIPEYLASPT